MIGVREFDGIALSNKQFPKMQSGIVYEVDVAAKEPGLLAILDRNTLVMYERRLAEQELDMLKIFNQVAPRAWIGVASLKNAGPPFPSTSQYNPAILQSRAS